MKLSRRKLLSHSLAVPLGLGLSPFLALRPANAAGTQALAIVMNSGESSVSVIDMATRKVV
jgi:hypothetical protein